MSYSEHIRKVLETMTTTTRYTPSKLRYRKSNIRGEENVDFPYVEDPTPYETHKTLEQRLMEQPPGAATDAPPQDPGTPGADPAMGEGMPGDDPGMEGDPSLGAIDPAMAGVGTPDRDYVKLDSNDLGRVYEMKKIYARLTSVESYLTESTDEELLELRRGVGKAIDLFEVVITNISKFKDKIDPIIVTFYEFLDQVYSALRKYHVGQSASER